MIDILDLLKSVVLAKGIPSLEGWELTAMISINALFILFSLHYFFGFGLDLFWFSRKVKKVDMSGADDLRDLIPRIDANPNDPMMIKLAQRHFPRIVLFYPVLRESEDTMRSTLISLARIEYPKNRREVVAIPNASDLETVASLRRLQSEFPFLKLHEVPIDDIATNPSWNVVWNAWDNTPANLAYWWHHDETARDRNLPPKKTRQLIHAFYTVHSRLQAEDEDFLVDYIDADSCPPRDHFLAAALGMKQGFDVLQATNVAGNLLNSFGTIFCALDHMAWDGHKYWHQTSGTTPYWMLGKGLFYKGSDLFELGGFNPWTTIEDPEVGMRFWKNGRKLGLIEAALIEEVPDTFNNAVIQRKRWVAGFFQSLTRPLSRMGFTPMEKIRCWLLFMPCLSLTINGIAVPIMLVQAILFFMGASTLPSWAGDFALINMFILGVSLMALYWNTWARTRLVLDSKWHRARYLFWISPPFIIVWWWWWIVPLAIGLHMFFTNGGKVWERTEKLDRNHVLVRERTARGTLGYTEKVRLTHTPVDQAAN